jgi:hypothetical protein
MKASLRVGTPGSGRQNGRVNSGRVGRLGRGRAKEFPSFAALARHEGMAPQRVAQILELTLLAPDTGPLTPRPPSR